MRNGGKGLLGSAKIEAARNILTKAMIFFNIIFSNFSQNERRGHHNMRRLIFQPAKVSQREMLHQWLTEDHIREWVHGQGLENLLNGLEKFFQYQAEGRDLSQITNHWIGYEADIPFIYMLTSQISKTEPSEYLPYCEKEGRAMTLDVFIGNKNYLGKGLAHLAIQEFLSSQCQHVTEVFIDPEKTNQRAFHVYQKVGFQVVGEFIAPWHAVPHYLMKYLLK
jgi:RimJ/RimL family protein N-acetyltransferase